METLPDKDEKFKVDGWLERVMREKAIVAKKK
jgi:hypothetical protein